VNVPLLACWQQALGCLSCINHRHLLRLLLSCAASAAAPLPLPHRLLHFFSIYTISMTCQSSKMAALPVVNPIKTDTIHYIPAFYPTNSMMNLTHLERRIVFLVFSNSHTRQLHINISHEVSSLHCSGMNDDQIFFSLSPASPFSVLFFSSPFLLFLKK